MNILSLIFNFFWSFIWFYRKLSAISSQDINNCYFLFFFLDTVEQKKYLHATFSTASVSSVLILAWQRQQFSFSKKRKYNLPCALCFLHFREHRIRITKRTLNKWCFFEIMSNVRRTKQQEESGISLSVSHALLIGFTLNLERVYDTLHVSHLKVLAVLAYSK